MTDDDMQIFLTLKFPTMTALVDGLREATGVDARHIASDAAVREVLKEWVEQGCPKKIVVPDNKASLFLCFKFGTVKDAYDYWIHLGPAKPHDLSPAEEQVLLDYVEPKRS